MKHIYIILSLILSCNIYAQEKELDLQKLAELVSSDEDFNQYFEELGWSRSADSLNIYFETTESKKTTVYAIKNIGNPNLFIMTDKKKVISGWEKQIEKFAEFFTTQFSPEQQIHQYKYNEAIYGWFSEKDAQTGLYSIFVMKPKEVEQKPTNVTQPKGGLEDFRRDFARRFRIDDKMNNVKVEIKLMISAEGKVTNISVIPYNELLYKQVKEILNEVEWIPAVDETGNSIKSTFTWKINVQSN